MIAPNNKNEVTEFDLELAEYEGYKITCIIHGLEQKQLDIELLYSSDLEAEAENIRRLVTAIIVTALKEADKDKDIKQFQTFDSNPYTV